MGTITKAVGTVVLAGGIFVAGLWTGGADLDRTKEVIDEMVSIIGDKDTQNKALQTEKERLEQLVTELEEQVEEGNNNGNIAKGLRKQLDEAKVELELVKENLAKTQSEIEKANVEIDRANADAKELRTYAEQKLAEVKGESDE